MKLWDEKQLDHGLLWDKMIEIIMKFICWKCKMSLPNAPSDLSSTKVEPEDQVQISWLTIYLIDWSGDLICWRDLICWGRVRGRTVISWSAPADLRATLEISNITRLLHHRPTTPRAKFESYVKYTQLEEPIYFVLFCSLLPSCYDS